MLNDAELIQTTLALAAWQECIQASERHHARAEALVAKSGQEIVIRDERASALRFQSQALESLARALDMVARIPRNDARHALDEKLQEMLRRSLRDYLTLQELAGADEVVEITRDIWATGGYLKIELAPPPPYLGILEARRDIGTASGESTPG